MMQRKWLLLEPLAAGQDLVLLLLRLLTGWFLVWEMCPNISSAETMTLVVGYFAQHGFAYPEFFAPLSAWAQFVIGVALILGLLTRWAGLLLAFNFVVGLVMVHMSDTFRDQWPAWALLGFGLLFATAGAGRYAVDQAFAAGASGR
jgi:putative oxidoreductase